MAEKRKNKRKREEDFECIPTKRTEKPSKEEFAIARWMKNNVPVKKTKFAGHNVEYFTGAKAVTALMNSKWSNKDGEKDPLFLYRHDVVYLLDTMLRHKFFHRAKKVPISEQELKAKLRKKERKVVEDEKKKKDEETAESSHAEGKEVDDKTKTMQEDGQKKRKKIKLEMHFEQTFVDNLDAYVWIFDPIPFYYWVIGALVVLAAVGICLFPLWPPNVRLGVQYISMAAAGFLILILGLAVLRLIIFCIIWALSFGGLHLWLLPNLTEDVGFFASFWPLYQYKYVKKSSGVSGKEKKSKSKKCKYSDDEDTKGGKTKIQREQKLENDEDVKLENEPVSATNVTECKIDPKSKPEDTTADSRIGNDSESDSTESSSLQSQTERDFEIIENELDHDKET